VTASRVHQRRLPPEDGKFLTLTENGRFFADEVCHQFHHPDYVPFPRETYHPGQLFPYND